MNIGRIYIVRHGNTFDKGDVILRVGGRTDLNLSASGQAQATRLAKAFGGLVFSHAYSSNLKRTRQTTEAILRGQSYQLATFLKEIDYGPDEGCPETDVISRIGANALRQWDKQAISPPDWDVNPNDLRTAWQAFLANCSQNANTLVVTSNGVARFLLDVVDGGKSAPKKLRTGAYGIVELRANGPTLLSWNVRPET